MLLAHSTACMNCSVTSSTHATRCCLVHQVLNMKPPEIMSLLEEAAGTRMYERKKDCAVKTLDKKQQRLEEIDKVGGCPGVWRQGAGLFEGGWLRVRKGIGHMAVPGRAGMVCWVLPPRVDASQHHAISSRNLTMAHGTSRLP